MFTRLFLFVSCALLAGLAVVAPASAQLNLTQFDYPAGSDTAFSVTTGDFDGDGVADLASATTMANSVAIMLGKGDGTFGPPASFGAGAQPYSVASADFNGDGHADLVTANLVSNDLTVLLGMGDGTFGPPSSYVPQYWPFSVISADFNRDGKADLAYTAPPYTWVALGNGDGTFAPSIKVETSSPWSVASADFNGDGIRDLVTANAFDASVSVALGVGDGTFGPVSDFAAGDRPESVTSADFNRDGIRDLATANADSNDLSVLLGNGDGTFGSSTEYAIAPGSSSVVSADFSGDDIPDLAAGSQDAGRVSVILGEGDGTFGPTTIIGNIAGGHSIVAKDFNGDGAPDLAASATNVVSVFMNSPTAQLGPASLTFGSAASPVPQGTASAPQTVTVTNDSSAPVTVSGFEITGADADDFDTGTQNCLRPIAPGGSCQVRVRFFPQAEGERQANLELLSNAPTTSVALSGIAGPLPQGPTGPTGPTGATGSPGPYAAIGKVKVSGPAKVRKGRVAKFKVVVSNSGNAPARGVKLNVTGKGVRLGKAIGNVAGGAARTVVVKVKPKRTGKVKLKFAVRSDNAGGRIVGKTIRVGH
ncbi:MAG: VCBS repeat-containing protein [Solirubrobacterales bacterium]|nr:VCBS repeat-containing protein [Solirubrobacterales bacterium]